MDSSTKKRVLPRQRMGEYERCPWGPSEAPRALAKLAHRGGGPPYFQIRPGGVAYYDLGLFDQWLGQHMVGSTAQASGSSDVEARP